MSNSRKITVSKTKVGEHADPGRPEEVWDKVEVVEVWYHDGSWGGKRGYYLHVSIWRERVELVDSVERPGHQVKITQTMLGLGSSGTKLLLEEVPRFNQKRAAYWASVMQSDLRVEAMKARVREMQQGAA